MEASFKGALEGDGVEDARDARAARDPRTAAAWGLAAATALLLAAYGRDAWIVAVGAAVLGLLLAGALVFRLLARELAPRDEPRRRLLRHRGLLASGLAASGASCLLAAALVTRHAEARWDLLYGLLALLMTAGVTAIRFAYHGGHRVDAEPER